MTTRFDQCAGHEFTKRQTRDGSLIWAECTYCGMITRATTKTVVELESSVSYADEDISEIIAIANADQIGEPLRPEEKQQIATNLAASDGSEMDDSFYSDVDAIGVVF